MDSSPHSAWLKDQVAFASRVAVVGDYRDRRSFIEHSFEVDGLGYFEVCDGGDAFTTRRVHMQKDWELLYRVLTLAEKRWPSKHTYHKPCKDCWQASPCVAIRAWWEGDSEPRTSPLYIQTGCGEIKPVMGSIEQKIYFIRRRGVDAFLAWVDRSHDRPLL